MALCGRSGVTSTKTKICKAKAAFELLWAFYFLTTRLHYHLPTPTRKSCKTLLPWLLITAWKKQRRPFVLSSGSSVPLLSLKSLSQKVTRSSLMRPDRLRAAKTLSSCSSGLHRGCCRSRCNPVAEPSDLLLLYVFPRREHLTKDNLFGCLMLWHWLVEDYMRWPGDLWRLVVGWRTCVSEGEWGRSVCERFSVCVCVQFQVLALTQTSVVFHPACSQLPQEGVCSMFVLFWHRNILRLQKDY